MAGVVSGHLAHSLAGSASHMPRMFVELFWRARRSEGLGSGRR
jgi:hypothetical protein